MSVKNILIVDDDDAFRLFLKELLNKSNYHIQVASDGVGAIQLMIDNDFDLIISDYRMKPLGGAYWIRFLKRFCENTNVVIISGFLEQEDDIPYPVFYKPIDTQALLKCIDDLNT
jgi:CheY-like chemotaxis protein